MLRASQASSFEKQVISKSQEQKPAGQLDAIHPLSGTGQELERSGEACDQKQKRPDPKREKEHESQAQTDRLGLGDISEDRRQYWRRARRGDETGGSTQRECSQKRHFLMVLGCMRGMRSS